MDYNRTKPPEFSNPFASHAEVSGEAFEPRIGHLSPLSLGDLRLRDPTQEPNLKVPAPEQKKGNPLLDTTPLPRVPDSPLKRLEDLFKQAETPVNLRDLSTERERQEEEKLRTTPASPKAPGEKTLSVGGTLDPVSKPPSPPAGDAERAPRKPAPLYEEPQPSPSSGPRLLRDDVLGPAKMYAD